MRRTVVALVLTLVSALVTGCDDEPAQEDDKPPAHLIRQLQDGRSIRAVDACDAVRAIPSIEERVSEILGAEVTYYEDYYGEAEHRVQASCDLAVGERTDERMVFSLHEESDIATGYQGRPIEIFEGCRVDPHSGNGSVSVACGSSLEMGLGVAGVEGYSSTCGSKPDDACATLMRDFLIAIDEQDPDQDLDPDDEGRPEVIAELGGGENELYEHDVCKAITSAGLEDELARQLEVEDLVTYSSFYGHPRDEEVIACDFYVDADPAEEGRENAMSIALALSRSPVEPASGDEEVFPGCLIDGLRAVCGEHLVLRLEGGYAYDVTDSIEDFPALAHDVLVTLSKQG